MARLTRRHAALAALAAFASPARGETARVLPVYPQVKPGRAFRFPEDHGAHPEFRTEWWYVTGWLDASGGGPGLGFQVTFFRTRPQTDQRNPSAFAPKQILFAHAALSDPAAKRLAHDQRAARAGFGLAEARLGDADVVVDDWRLWRTPDGAFRAKAAGADFAFDLVFRPTQPPLLQGQAGYSRKGPRPEQASYYYSLPQLAVSGRLRQGRRWRAARGRAWMDREWSSSILAPGAVGWDWTGINLDDGAALMAFQVRGRDGGSIWAGGSLRPAGGAPVEFGPGDVSFTPARRWRSPRTGAVYPVETTVTVRLPSGPRRWRLTPLFDDQELDSRAAGGPVYWEGAVTAPGGRGYLELTGYAGALKL
jgi:predicted secreted hydrolase